MPEPHTFPPAMHDGSLPDPHPAPAPMALRAIAAFLESHPEVEPYDISLTAEPIRVTVFGCDAQKMRLLIRSLGGIWRKEALGTLISVAQEIAPGVVLDLVGNREGVCERVVVGTEEIEVPDPDAPMVTQVVEKVEWRCGSLLGGSARG